MNSTTPYAAFRAGVVAGAPFLFVVGPFAMLFGIIATEAGLSVAQTMGFSVLVIAGASQVTAIQLMTEHAPVWIVITAALAVNLRMAMYSASLQPHLGDATLAQRALVAYLNADGSYAVSIQHFEAVPDRPVREKVAFFVGTATLMMPLWVLGTWVGAIAGDVLPDWFELDFAMPIVFLAMVGPMLKTLAHLGAAVTSIVGALVFSFLPSGIGLLIAAAIAMAVGAEIERRQVA